ncbi:energy transducer TonB [Alkalispirochaeta alkalica]|uniref:energy transducer TonB n=1 Tax=Alkalispirochaeta alkalica TaxID=46356 RepID=UPI00039B9811|nr:energy transducer TonB [Alkalispirochaeta alkalica]
MHPPNRPGSPRSRRLATALGLSLALHLLVFAGVPLIPGVSPASADPDSPTVLTVQFRHLQPPDPAASSPPGTQARNKPASGEPPRPSPSEEPQSAEPKPADPSPPPEPIPKPIPPPRNQDTSPAPAEIEPLLTDPTVADPPLVDSGLVDSLLANPARGDRDQTSSHQSAPAPEGPPAGPRVHEPRPVDPIVPSYPLADRRRGIEGEVLIRVVISARGTPLKTEVLRPGPSRSLTRAALDAVESALFHPGTIDDTPSEMDLQVRIVFTLSST